MKKPFKIRSLLKAKKQKFDVPKVTPLMKGDCVCESLCNEYCSAKKQTLEYKINEFHNSVDEIAKKINKAINKAFYKKTLPK